MPYTGVIHFQNDLSEQRWSALLEEFDLKSSCEAEMFAPMIGEYVKIQDPPNLLAFVQGTGGEQRGVIRCSRFFFDGGVGETAEISFQGDGAEFVKVIERICAHLSGDITVDEPSA